MTMTRLRHSYQDYGTGRNTHIEFETPFISSHDTFDHDVIFSWKTVPANPQD
jgi:hypothetical protein